MVVLSLWQTIYCVTNAHVVIDSNNTITLQSEACQTMSEDEVPVFLYVATTEIGLSSAWDIGIVKGLEDNGLFRVYS